MTGVSSDMKKTLRRFLKTHLQIKAKAKEIALLRKEFKVIKEDIGVIMKTAKVNVLDIGDFDVCFKNNKQAASLSKEFLAAQTVEFFKKKNAKLDASVGQEFVEFLWNKKKEEGVEKERITVRKHRVRKRKNAESEDTPIKMKSEDEATTPVEIQPI